MSYAERIRQLSADIDPDLHGWLWTLGYEAGCTAAAIVAAEADAELLGMKSLLSVDVEEMK